MARASEVNPTPRLIRTIGRSGAVPHG